MPPHGMSRAQYNAKLKANATRRRYVDGAVYLGKEVTNEDWDIITLEQIRSHKKLLFFVTTEGDESTVVEVSCFHNYNSDQVGNLLYTWRDGDDALRPQDFTARNGKKDEGDMAPIGRRRGGETRYGASHEKAGEVFQTELYKATLENKKMAEAVAACNRETKRYCQELHPELVAEIAEATKSIGAKISEEMGGEEGLAPSGAISKNLGNAAHRDVFDKCRAISTWIERITGMAKGLYFLMPNVSVNGDGRPVAIQLGTGVSIVWDGRIINHCTSVADIGVGNAVYGNFFGVSCKNKYGTEGNMPNTKLTSHKDNHSKLNT